MSSRIDLHMHSTASDGTDTPLRLAEKAKAAGIEVFALTDHDTVAGAEQLAGRLPEGVTFVPGIEFSTEYNGKDIHILGLYIEYEAPFFKQQLQEFVDSRIARNQKMCANLQGAGIDISYEKLQAAFPGSVITRGHYAKYLLDHGYIKSIPEAFERYIGDRAKYFVPREKVTPSQAVQLILKANGLPVLAHPPLYHMSDASLDTLVNTLAEDGLAGIEAIYSTYHQAEERHMHSLAKKYGLCISGGSDFHGSSKPGLEMATGYGKLCVPEKVLDDLKAIQKKRKEMYHE